MLSQSHRQRQPAHGSTADARLIRAIVRLLRVLLQQKSTDEAKRIALTFAIGLSPSASQQLHNVIAAEIEKSTYRNAPFEGAEGGAEGGAADGAVGDAAAVESSKRTDDATRTTMNDPAGFAEAQTVALMDLISKAAVMVNLFLAPDTRVSSSWSPESSDLDADTASTDLHALLLACDKVPALLSGPPLSGIQERIELQLAEFVTTSLFAVMLLFPNRALFSRAMQVWTAGWQLSLRPDLWVSTARRARANSDTLAYLQRVNNGFHALLQRMGTSKVQDVYTTPLFARVKAVASVASTRNEESRADTTVAVTNDDAKSEEPELTPHELELLSNMVFALLDSSRRRETNTAPLPRAATITFNPSNWLGRQQMRGFSDTEPVPTFAGNEAEKLFAVLCTGALLYWCVRDDRDAFRKYFAVWKGLRDSGPANCQRAWDYTLLVEGLAKGRDTRAFNVAAAALVRKAFSIFLNRSKDLKLVTFGMRITQAQLRAGLPAPGASTPAGGSPARNASAAAPRRL